MVWHSQFNSISGNEDNLTPEEAIEYFGENVKLWKKYDQNFKFVLIDADKGVFRAERRVFMSRAGGGYMPLRDGIGTLKVLTQKFCPHMGRKSYFHTVPEGFDE